MGISLLIVLIFVFSIGMLLYGVIKRKNSIKLVSIFLLILSLGLGFFIFNLIGYM